LIYFSITNKTLDKFLVYATIQNATLKVALNAAPVARAGKKIAASVWRKHNLQSGAGGRRTHIRGSPRHRQPPKKGE